MSIFQIYEKLAGGQPAERLVTKPDLSDGDYWYLKVPPDAEWVTVRVLHEPENWPPQAGDIWEADGKEWACMTTPDGSGSDMLFQVDDYKTYGPETFKALNPTLVRRRGGSE